MYFRERFSISSYIFLVVSQCISQTLLEIIYHFGPMKVFCCSYYIWTIMVRYWDFCHTRFGPCCNLAINLSNFLQAKDMFDSISILFLYIPIFRFIDIIFFNTHCSSVPVLADFVVFSSSFTKYLFIFYFYRSFPNISWVTSII